MHIRCKLIERGMAPIDATLTTEHSASSYGLPVLAIDGEPHGPADLTDGYLIEIGGYIGIEQYRAMRRAGYASVKASIRGTFDLDAELVLLCDQLAAREMRNRRDVMEAAIREYLAKEAGR